MRAGGWPALTFSRGAAVKKGCASPIDRTLTGEGTDLDESESTNDSCLPSASLWDKDATHE